MANLVICFAWLYIFVTRVSFCLFQYERGGNKRETRFLFIKKLFFVQHIPGGK